MTMSISNIKVCYFTDQMRSITGMSQDKYVPSGFEKLCLSLLGGLPNEVDYALNIITILSKNEKSILQLSKVPKLVDLLLAQTGMYSKGKSFDFFSFSFSFEPSKKKKKKNV